MNFSQQNLDLISQFEKKKRDGLRQGVAQGRVPAPNA